MSIDITAPNQIIEINATNDIVEINAISQVVNINESSQVVEITAASGIIEYDPTNLVTFVRNQTGSTINKFKVVYISGATGNKPLITLASNLTESTSSKTYGITRDVILNNGTGYVVTVGELKNVDTSAYNEGDQLWLGTNGNVLTTPPAEPAHAVFIGFIVRSHPQLGVVDVRIQNGYELNELHGVEITTPTNGQVLKYNSATGLWVNSSDLDTGITTLNTLTALSQNFATGTSGDDFSITSSLSTHTFNIPTSSALNRGLLSSSDWSTFNNKQSAISLTTTGSSGASTFIANTLNIPNYTLSGLGGVPTSRQLTINGTAFDLSADRSWSVGTVTSVAATAGTGISISGSPITSSGTLTITNTAPDQIVSLTGAGTTLISGTYPSFTITSNDQFNGTVTSVSVVSANGLAGTVANASTTPAITLSTTVTGILKGNGTGISAAVAGTDYVIPSALNSYLPLAGGTMSGFITLNADPTQALHPVTKQYVDAIAEGLHVHASCEAATPNTLASITGGTVTYNNGPSGVGATLTLSVALNTLDGVTLVNGNRILVKNEANNAHNGIYVRTSSTILTRATDSDTATELAGGDFTFVTGGTLYDNTGWVQIEPCNVVGTDPINYNQFSGAGTYLAGTGLTLTGNTFSANIGTDIQGKLTLTTTGNSGSATLVTNTLNIPTYTLTGLGGFANPMTTLGDIIYGAASGTATRLAGNTTTAKQYLSQTGNGTASAAPSWATIAGSDITGAAITKTDDTNVTLTLGGTPSTALLRAASLTLGWTGQLAVGRGGSGASTLTGVLIGNGTSAFTGVAGTESQYLRRNAGNTAYEFGAIAGADVTGAALTKTDDTNVTLTLGGTPATSLLRAASLTLGWTGTLAVSRGGTGAGTLTGVVIGNGTSAMTSVASTTPLQIFRVNAAGNGYEFAAAPSGNNIYNSNGTVDADRTVTLADKRLLITGTNSPTNYAFTFNGVKPTSTLPVKFAIEQNHTFTSSVSIPTTFTLATSGYSTGANGSMWQTENYLTWAGTGTFAAGLQGHYLQVSRGGTLDVATSTNSILNGLTVAIGHPFTTTQGSTTTSITTATVKGIESAITNIVGNMTNAYGIVSRSYISNNTVADNVRSSAVTNLYNVYIANNIGGNFTATATVTNLYALYIDSVVLGPQGTISNRWGIYAPDSAMKHYLNGNLLLGTTTDSGEKLVVNGNVKVSGTGLFDVTDAGVGTKTIAATFGRNGATASGTAREVGIVFRDDAGTTLVGGITGVRENSAGTWLGGLKFYVNSNPSSPATTFSNLTEAFSVTSNGFFGIGTTNPINNLVISNAGALGIEFNPSAATGTIVDIYAYNRSTSAYKPIRLYAEDYRFIASTTEITRLKSTGQLQLHNYTSTSSFTGTAVGVLAFDASGNILTIATPGGGSGSPGGSNGQVQFNSSGSFGGDSNFFWDNTNKRLGIGTASPSQKLTVEGSAGYLFTVQENSANQVKLQFYIDANEASIISQYATTAKPLSFYTSNTKQVTLTTGGNLLVGTTTDSGERLQVSGNSKFIVSTNGTSDVTDGTIVLRSQIGAEGRFGTQSNHDLVLTTNNTTRLTIASTGAASFSSSVTVNSNLIISNTAIEQNDSNGLTLNSSNASGSIKFRVAGAERMILNSSGSLGLGVTPQAWGRVGFEIGIEGAAITRATRNLVLLSNAYWGATDLIYAAGAGAGRYDVAVDGHRWYTAPTGTAGNVISFTQTMTLDASGNLNIGQISSALQSGGTGLTIYGATNSEIKFLNSTTGTTASDGTALVTSGSDFTINNREAGSVVIGTSNTVRSTIKSTGQLQLHSYQAANSFTGTYVGLLAFDVSGNILTLNTLNNTRIDPRSITTTSTATLTPDLSVDEFFTVTAQAAAITLANPTGTPVDGQRIIIRIKDNGTARAINYGTQYRGSSDYALPTTTTVNRTIYLGFIYNSVDVKWDLLAKLDNFA